MWIKKYMELMFPFDGSKVELETINEAKELKLKNIPNKLYKYRKVSEHSLSNLYSNTIRMSTLKDMNDPQECPFYYDESKAMSFSSQMFMNSKGMRARIEELEISEEELEKIKYKELFFKIALADEEFKGNIEKVEVAYATIMKAIKMEMDYMSNTFVDAYRESTFIYSMTTNVNNNLMWSHYANEHTGVCIEFDFSSPHTDDMLKYSLYPVIYQNDKVEASSYHLKNGKPNIFAGTYFSMIKSPDWKYEDEWRIIFPIGPNHKPFNRLSPKVSAIYLGCEMTNDNIKKFMAFSDENKIELFKMVKNPRSFRMNIEVLKTFK